MCSPCPEGIHRFAVGRGEGRCHPALDQSPSCRASEKSLFCLFLFRQMFLETFEALVHNHVVHTGEFLIT